jgi:hypothetical protein
MKIYLILEYKKDQAGNVWAETQAFTSAMERDKAFSAMPAEVDKETQDLTITKRTYIKHTPEAV